MIPLYHLIYSIYVWVSLLAFILILFISHIGSPHQVNKVVGCLRIHAEKKPMLVSCRLYQLYQLYHTMYLQPIAGSTPLESNLLIAAVCYFQFLTQIDFQCRARRIVSPCVLSKSVGDNWSITNFEFWFLLSLVQDSKEIDQLFSQRLWRAHNLWVNIELSLISCHVKYIFKTDFFLKYISPILHKNKILGTLNFKRHCVASSVCWSCILCTL